MNAAEAADSVVRTGSTVEKVPLLRVEDLAVEFRVGGRWIRVVEDVQLTIDHGQTVGLVGESGSGKTVTSLAIMGLIGDANARIPHGSVRLNGRELVGLPERELRKVRGSEIGMIFQEPRRSLNPAFNVGHQIAEVLTRHRGLSRRAAWDRAVELLDTVGIPTPERRARNYPHEFSGGMCQRVMLAIALACEPKLLIADEPTTALDVTVQAQMLRLMSDLQENLQLSILFITHDLGVVAEMCDVVGVMYAGQLVEVSPLYSLFEAPQHPYTEGLLASIPQAHKRTERLRSIPGMVPSPLDFPTGCRFHPRCSYCETDRCTSSVPDLVKAPDGRLTRCVRFDELDLRGIASD